MSNESPTPAPSAPTLREAIDHPILRQLFGAIEDSGTRESDYLWSLCTQWFDVRDAALRGSSPSETATVIAEIAAERCRQVEEEGWTPEHDDAHGRGEMAEAAACYIQCGVGSPNPCPPNAVPTWWPWGRSWWKPKSRRRDLIRAAALTVAEIERLDRAALQSEAPANG